MTGINRGDAFADAVSVHPGDAEVAPDVFDAAEVAYGVVPVTVLQCSAHLDGGAEMHGVRGSGEGDVGFEEPVPVGVQAE